MTTRAAEDHHYVPQFYMRQFALLEDKNKVMAVERHGDILNFARKSVGSIGYEKRLHDFVENRGTKSIESEVNKLVEMPFAESPTWKKIVDGECANVSVATAYVTDITPEELRTRRFGMMSAMFGAGFIVGPVLGGMLGEYWVRLPFLAAAILNAANLLLAFITLPESHPRSTARFDPRALNPFAPLRWLFSMPRLLPFVLVYFALSGAGEAYGVCWALWGYDAFRWNGFWIGLSLGAFGIWQTLVQVVLPGRTTKRLGERKAILAGLACSCVALAGLAFASRGWMVFLIMPVFALGSIGTPALQALATRGVDNDRQGQLQGLLASTVSLASIIAPLGFTAFYFTVHRQWPGAIWLAVAAINLAVVPLVLLGTRQRHMVMDRS